MSVIGETLVISGFSTRLLVNNQTSNAVLLGRNGLQYASSTSKKWKVDDIASMTYVYNNANLSSLTKDEVKRLFINNQTAVLNEKRAELLNNPNNFDSLQVASDRQSNFYKNRIPFIIDPATNTQNNRNGDQTLSTSNQRVVSSRSEVYRKSTDEDSEVIADVTSDNESESSGSSTPPVTDVSPQASGIRNNVTAEEDASQPVENKGVTALKNLVTSATSNFYRYPLSVPEDMPYKYDYIEISAYDYEPSIQNGTSGGAGTSLQSSISTSDEFNGSSRFGTKRETITLPMHPNIRSTNAVQFGEDKMNPLQLTMAQAGNMAGLNDTGSANFENIGSLYSDAKFKDSMKALQAHYAGKAIGANVTGRVFGGIINPNMELLFTGPKMRQFEFSFRMTPRNEKESQQVRKIIKSLKRNMSPQRTVGNIFLKTPRVFQLRYIYNQGAEPNSSHPFLPKFKACALTSFTANFTPDGSYMTYGKDGSMSAYELSMTFEELVPIYEDNYDDRDDMGY